MILCSDATGVIPIAIQEDFFILRVWLIETFQGQNFLILLASQTYFLSNVSLPMFWNANTG